ncbi:MAG TPA: MFS transporter [Ktedonobacterales bacterium]
MSDASPSTTKARSASPLTSPTFAFWVLLILNFLNYLNRYVFVGLTPLIQKDLKFNDAELGLLGSVFFLVYTVVALPIGYLADRVARKAIVAGSMFLMSIATILTGFFPSLNALLGVKVLLGTGQGAFYPSSTPLLAAQFSPSRRARILGTWTAGALVGAGLGFLMASFFDVQTWRNALYIVGVPGIIMGFLVLLIREKTRHEEDPAPVASAAPQKTFFARLRDYWSIPTFRTIVGMHAAGFFALTSIAFWLPIYLANTYGRTVNQYDQSGIKVGAPVPSHFGDAGLSPGLVPVLAGGVVLLGGILGNLYGPRMARSLARRSSGARVLAGGLGFLLAAPMVIISIGSPWLLGALPFYAQANLSTQLAIGVGVFTVFALAGSFFLNVYNGPTTAALLDVIPAEERSAAGGAELTMAHLLGDVYATVLVGVVAVFLTRQLGGEQIGLALIVLAPIALVISGVIGIRGARHYAEDVQRLGTTAEAMTGQAVPV